MWCTRWFLPLVILPLPSAPPYFLLVLLLSQFVHARPCFYCMMLLTALYTSSCYWQALRMDAPFTHPLAEGGANVNASITTFADSVRAGLSSDALAALSAGTVALPPFVQLLDRCWCNFFPLRGLFDQLDVPAWELASVHRLQRDIEARTKVLMDERLSKDKDKDSGSSEHADGAGDEEKVLTESDDESQVGAAVRHIQNTSGPSANDIASHANCSSVGDECEQTSGTDKGEHAESVPFLLRLKNLVLPFISSKSGVFPTNNIVLETRVETAETIETVEAPAISDSPTEAELSASATVSGESSRTEELPIATSSSVPQEQENHERLPIIRRFYDLRPYGLDITIDFGLKR